MATKLIVFDGGSVTVFDGGYGDFLDRVGWQAEGGRAPRRGRPGTVL